MGNTYSEKDRAAERNGAVLTAYLLKKCALSFEDIVTHKHWSGKECPLYILPHWEKFISMVKEEYEVLERAEALDNTPDSYAVSAISKATQKGLLKGDANGNLMLHSPLTRQDLFVILDRTGLL